MLYLKYQGTAGYERTGPILNIFMYIIVYNMLNHICERQSLEVCADTEKM